MNSVGRQRGVRIEKGGRLACERLVELKEHAVAGVRINEQHCVGQILTQPIGVAYRNHLVVYAVHDEGRVLDALQIRESIAAEMFPIAKSGDLCGSHFWAWRLIPIIAAW